MLGIFILNFAVSAIGRADFFYNYPGALVGPGQTICKYYQMPPGKTSHVLEYWEECKQDPFPKEVVKVTTENVCEAAEIGWRWQSAPYKPVTGPFKYEMIAGLHWNNQTNTPAP